MSDQQITYNTGLKLPVPEDAGLDGIMVQIEIEPAHAGCIIYGWLEDGNLGAVEVQGSHEKVELPFVNGQIYVKYTGGLENLRIGTLGYKDSRGTKRDPHQNKKKN